MSSWKLFQLNKQAILSVKYILLDSYTIWIMCLLCKCTSEAQWVWQDSGYLGTKFPFGVGLGTLLFASHISLSSVSVLEASTPSPDLVPNSKYSFQKEDIISCDTTLNCPMAADFAVFIRREEQSVLRWQQIMLFITTMLELVCVLELFREAVGQVYM